MLFLDEMIGIGKSIDEYAVDERQYLAICCDRIFQYASTFDSSPRVHTARYKTLTVVRTDGNTPPSRPHALTGHGMTGSHEMG